MAKFEICCLAGDGIGPEIMAEAKRVLAALETRFGHEFAMVDALIGGAAIDEVGSSLPDETLDKARKSDAVLLASVGGPKWDTTDSSKDRPEKGLLKIRKELELYCNLRPVTVFEPLIAASSLKPEIIQDTDMLIVRELTGGLYFGERGRFYDVPAMGPQGKAGMSAFDTMSYAEYEIERIARRAFEAARKRKNKVSSIDKANVLDCSRLWREVVHGLHEREYSDVILEDVLVDNAAMQLIRNPKDFDVILCENMFGDILSDEAAQLSGSLGMLASASLGDGVSLFEPSHGSAPDIAGKNLANPLAQLLSVELMLDYAFELRKEAQVLHQAITSALDEGYRTADIAGHASGNILSCSEMGSIIVEKILCS